uniref:Uncharacterized protein n=1 Tax=Anopheles melas TaxID=34690 RepID=A0A182TVU7_9DIPT
IFELKAASTAALPSGLDASVGISLGVVAESCFLVLRHSLIMFLFERYSKVPITKIIPTTTIGIITNSCVSLASECVGGGNGESSPSSCRVAALVGSVRHQFQTPPNLDGSASGSCGRLRGLAARSRYSSSRLRISRSRFGYSSEMSCISHGSLIMSNRHGFTSGLQGLVAIEFPQLTVAWRRSLWRGLPVPYASASHWSMPSISLKELLPMAMPAAEASVGSQSEMWNHWFETRCVSFNSGLQMSAAALIHGADTVVQLRHHGSVRATIAVADVRKTIDRFLRCLQRIIIVARVRCQMIHYQQHRLTALAMLGDDVSRGRVVHVRPQVADVRVEPPVRGYVVLGEEAKVPLPNHVRPIAGRAEVLRHDALVQPEAPRLVDVDHVVLHADVDRVSARHQGRPGRRTHRGRVVPVQDDTVVRERVNVRRRYLVRAVKSDVIPAHIVRGDEDDVGPLRWLLVVRRHCQGSVTDGDDDAYQQGPVMPSFKKPYDEAAAATDRIT